ncbi:hypothetical protein H7I76_37195, partial [Mycolicibacterium vaccae]|nr:hypothetical protein [Mycolicibacterium vaccae]
MRTYVRVRCSTRQTADILHADLDSFYASVEQRDDPVLRGRPVIVGAGVVLAASYEAKAYGVRTAMAGGRPGNCARTPSWCPPRMRRRHRGQRGGVRSVPGTPPPLVEPISVDEAFLDVGGLRRLRGPPVQIAARLRADVRDRVGLRSPSASPEQSSWP